MFGCYVEMIRGRTSRSGFGTALIAFNAFMPS